MPQEGGEMNHTLIKMKDGTTMVVSKKDGPSLGAAGGHMIMTGLKILLGLVAVVVCVVLIATVVA